MGSEFCFYERRPAVNNEYFTSDIDELRRQREDGSFDTMLFGHVLFHKFSKPALRSILTEWPAFRRSISAPIFAFSQDGEAEPEKWARFVRLLGFQEIPNAGVPDSNGRLRPVFISIPLHVKQPTDQNLKLDY